MSKCGRCCFLFLIQNSGVKEKHSNYSNRDSTEQGTALFKILFKPENLFFYQKKMILQTPPELCVSVPLRLIVSSLGHNV